MELSTARVPDAGLPKTDLVNQRGGFSDFPEAVSRVSISKDKAIEKLRDKISRVGELQNLRRGSTEFKKWRRDTRVAIENIFGQKSQHIKDFSSIGYSLSIISPGIPEARYQDAYQRGLENSVAILESLIDEINEYWEEDTTLSGKSLERGDDMRMRLIGNGKKIWVVHGRNLKATKAMFDWLRRIGLEPLEWNQTERMTENGSPGTLEIIEKGFESAQAFLILFTDDEEVQLRNELLEEDESPQSGYQPRPNVLFEGGMAYAIDRRRTVFVELGNLRRFTDLAGINTVRLGVKPKTKDLNKLIGRLENANCVIDKNGDHWMDTEDFEEAVFSPKD